LHIVSLNVYLAHALDAWLLPPHGFRHWLRLLHESLANDQFLSCHSLLLEKHILG
jgi:hypothetical protein